MKRLVVCLLLAALNALAAGPTYVQSKSTTAATSLAFASNNTAGNLILVIIGVYGAGSPYAYTSVSDSRNSYVPMGCVPAQFGHWFGSGGTACAWIATGIGAGANTVSISGVTATDGGPSLAILEYTPGTNLTLLPLLMINGTGTAMPSSGPWQSTWSFAGAVTMVNVAYDVSSSHTWTVSAGNLRESTEESGGQSMAVADQQVTSVTAGYSITFTGGSNGTNQSELLVPLANLPAAVSASCPVAQ
jgi:hypothetical protein